jgi:hypothetical protein
MKQNQIDTDAPGLLIFDGMGFLPEIVCSMRSLFSKSHHASDVGLRLEMSSDDLAAHDSLFGQTGANMSCGFVRPLVRDWYSRQSSAPGGRPLRRAPRRRKRKGARK